MIKSTITNLRDSVARYRLEQALLPGRKGWAIYEGEMSVRAEIKQPSAPRRVAAAITNYPLLAAGFTHVVISILVIIGFLFEGDFMPTLTPKNPSEVLATAWQVHAGFVAIAFAGLAMLIDMAGRESMVRAVVERRYLLRRTHFSLAFLFSVGGALQLGVVSTWFASPGTVLVEVLFIVTPSVLLIGFAYARAIRALTDPASAEETAAEVLLEELRISLDASRALALAEERLAQLAPLYHPLGEEGTAHELVVASKTMRFLDVHLPSLEYVAKGIGSIATTATTVAPDSPPATSPTAPVLRRRVPLGSSIQEGDSVFFVVGGSPSEQDLRSFERRLANTIHWERA